MLDIIVNYLSEPLGMQTTRDVFASYITTFQPRFWHLLARFKTIL